MSNKAKQKRIHEMLDSDQCPCPTCSSQDLKREGDDDFEIDDNLYSNGIREDFSTKFGRELADLTDT